jgi:hypothetical protein
MAIFIFCGNWVDFFPRFGMLYQEKAGNPDQISRPIGTGNDRAPGRPWSCLVRKLTGFGGSLESGRNGLPELLERLGVAVHAGGPPSGRGRLVRLDRRVRDAVPLESIFS